MSKETDISKVIRQHLEMEQFFTGFTIRSEGAERLATPPCLPVQTGMGAGFDNEKKMPQDDTVIAQKAAELEKIAEELSRCCQCGLGSSRTNAVPGEGSSNARIIFIGEAPGADEDAQGRPFVGRAGQLLDKIIAAMGLARSDVWIGNILKCRPPENRDPRPEEMISCLPFLQRQIEIIKPEIIVALGAHAARMLLNTNKSIGQLRGHFVEYYAGIGSQPIKLLATYHPAYLLRNYSPENRKTVWEDMKKVLTELGLPVPEHSR